MKLIAIAIFSLTAGFILFAFFKGRGGERRWSWWAEQHEASPMALLRPDYNGEPELIVGQVDPEVDLPGWRD